MKTISKLAVLVPCHRTSEALRFGFGRHGTQVMVAASAKEFVGLLEHGPEVAIAGGAFPAPGGELPYAIARRAIEASGRPVPLIGIDVSAGEIARGVTVNRPGLLRDVMTLAMLAKPDAVSEVAQESRERIYYLVRALLSGDNRAVLVLWRGIRRGEIAFRDGEVSSAQVGVLHGLPALRQLLLWPDAQTDLRWEDVPARGQVPLSIPELLEECSRFLAELDILGDGLSAASVLKARDSAGVPVPEQVSAVLGLCNGQRSIADVVADSALRTPETLQIVAQLVERGLVSVYDSHGGAVDRDAGIGRAALGIHEWQQPESTTRASGLRSGTSVSPPRGATATSMPASSVELYTDKEWPIVAPLPSGDSGRTSVVASHAAVGEIRARSSSSQVASPPDATVVIAAQLSASSSQPNSEGQKFAGLSDSQSQSTDVDSPLVAEPSRGKAVFSADEEDFFARGVAEEARVPLPVESFDDLDADYEIPRRFIDRFLSNPGELRRKK